MIGSRSEGPATRARQVQVRVPEAPARLARGLRIFETFPPLPRALAASGVRYLIALKVCVNADGTVRDVALVRGASPTLDASVVAAVRTWRYRSYVVGGVERPFCHPLRVVYSYLGS